MSFESVMKEHFAGAQEQTRFAERSLEALEPHGFTADNTIACVAVCRDELCTTMPGVVREVWGEAFNMSSLAGMVFCGVTSFKAAQAHSPVDNGKEHYVYFAMAHIGVGAGGEQGLCTRAGRTGESHACGALWALLSEIEAGDVDMSRDPDDAEYSLLKEALMPRLERGSALDLVQLTKTAREEAFETLEQVIERTVDPQKADFAVISGIQIHAPDGGTHVWVGDSYAVVDGVKTALTL